MRRKLAATAVVLRSFSNPHLTGRIEALLSYGVGRIVVVVDAKRDQGATPTILDQWHHDSRVQLLEIQEGYSWSSALNQGLAAIQMANAAAIRPEFRFILNCSVEAFLQQTHLEALLDEATDGPRVAVVGTTFQAFQDEQPIATGPSYRHPRNTGMLLNLEVLGPFLAGFDPWCDSVGGMEDIDFILRIAALTSFEVRLLDLQVPIIFGVHWDQAEKESRERRAIDQIVQRWRLLFVEDTNERQRIEQAIRSIGLIEM